MPPPVPEVLVTRDPLTPPAPAFSADAGGIVDFYGVVRGQEGVDEIAGLDYEAHVSMAEHQLAKLAGETVEHFPVLGLVVHHRIGFVATAEPSLFLRVTAAHRGAAFAAAQWLIDQLKLRVPIWKHPIPVEGTAGPAPEAWMAAGHETPDGQAAGQGVKTASRQAGPRR